MGYEPGTVWEGTVRSITSFGAFVDLPEGKSGLVHISEVASTYVSDIRQFLTEGQNIKVRIMNVDEKGRLSLSIRQAEAPAGRSIKREEPRRADRVRQPDAMPRQAAARSGGREEPDSFEEKLKHFMADSNSRISGVRQYEHRTRNRKR